MLILVDVLKIITSERSYFLVGLRDLWSSWNREIRHCVRINFANFRQHFLGADSGLRAF